MAARKSEGAAGDFPASAYAFVPDAAKPSTWKLRLKARPDGPYDKAMVGMAVAAMSPGGFRGNRVRLPMSAIGAVKAKLRVAWRETHPGEEMPAAISGVDERIRSAARRR